MTMARDGFRMLPTRYAGLHAVTATSSHSFPRHTHDEFGIGVITAGGQLSASGRGQVTAGAGDLITVNPGEVHDGLPLRGEARSWSMLYLDPNLLAAVQAGLGDAIGTFEFEQPVLSDRPDTAGFLSTFERVTTRDETARDMAIEQALLRLFAPLASGRDRRQAHGPSPGLGRARALIDDDPSRDTSLADLARETGLSRFQTLRAFRALTGLTPHAYLLQRRIADARRRIAGGASLALAAAESGFSDQSHMTREFRRRYGLTPAAYRMACLSCNSVQDA